MTSPHPLDPRVLLAVLLGGGIGTGLRLLIDTLLPHTSTELAWSTLLVNVLGAFLLGTLVSTVFRRGAPLWLRAGLGAGVLGSFTTFSAIAASVTAMMDAGNDLTAAAYLLATLVLGLLAAGAGLLVARPRLAAEVDE